MLLSAEERLQMLKYAFIIVWLVGSVMTGHGWCQPQRKFVSRNAALTAMTIEIDLLKNTLAASGNCKLQNGEEMTVTSDKMTGTMKENEIAELQAFSNVTIRYLSLDDNGGKREIGGASSEAVWQPVNETLTLTGGARLNVAANEGPTTLTAKQIALRFASDSFTASGDCRLTSPAGELSSERMEGNLQTGGGKEITANGQVRIAYKRADRQGKQQDFEGSCGQAVWQSAEDNQDRLVLTGDARVKAPGETPVDLRAARLEINLKGNSFTATGQCSLISESAEMTGDQMVGTLGTGDRHELTTSGNVKVKTTYTDPNDGSKKQALATGRQSVYHPSDQRLVITGDAMLQVSDMSAKVKGAKVGGDKIIINLKTQRIQISTDDPNKPTSLSIEGQ